MKFILPLLLLLPLSVFSQDDERCSSYQMKSVLKHATVMCQEHLNEFASRSNASCKVLKIAANACWAECLDEEKEKLAKVRVALNSDCGRDQVYYHRTVIKYYR